MLETLQVNLGYRCNQSCVHCHVNAGPNRTEMMDADTLGLVPAVLRARNVRTLDLTGGAPELHDGFPLAGGRGARLGVRVIDRCNLTDPVRARPGRPGGVPGRHRVEVVASLPCYSADNVDRQRGKGVFDKSIAALQQLNALGYGRDGSGLTLNLVYNPQGPVAAAGAGAPRSRLQARALASTSASSSTTCSCWPTCRSSASARMLVSKGQFDAYMRLLQGELRRRATWTA